jgi:hypothetical protein
VKLGLVLRLVALLTALAVPALAAAPISDAQRLREGLPPGFRRPVLLVYPVLDARPLGSNTPSAVGNELFDAFIAELSRFGNLDVQPPARTLARIKARNAWSVQEQFARSKADEGQEDYKQVRLDAAARHLLEAAERFDELEYTYVDARAVARAQLSRGLALREKGDDVDANAAFTRALQADPRLRLREKFDRADYIAAFERARTALLVELPLPEGFDKWPKAEAASTDTFLLRARLLPADEKRPERLEVLVIASGGVVLPDVQPVAAPDAAGRLAARVWASLPFGRAVRDKRSANEVRLDAGFTWFVFGENDLGTGIFNNVGAQTSFNWTLAKNIGLQASLKVANSGRDREEDLRADILTFRGFIGPGYEARFGAWRLDTHVGVEVASPGRIVTTDNVYCKQFPDDPRFCPEGDISIDDRTVVVGAGLTAGVSYDLVDDIYLSLQIDASEYLYEVTETELGRPVGAAVSLGYRFR